MGNFFIIIIIACAILWWDGRRRKKATRKAWEDIGVTKNTYAYKSPLIKEIPKTPVMSPEELLELMANWIEKSEPKQTEDEPIKELVDNVLNEIPSEEIAYAKSALKVLGYKDRDIKKAMDKIIGTIKGNTESGEIVTSALRILNA